MNEALREAFTAIVHAHDLMTWSLMFIVFLTFLSLVWTGYIAYLIRREGRESRREMSEVLKEMREDSKRMQFDLFSKLGPAELK